MKFALVVSALGSLVFALAVAGVYAIVSEGFIAVVVTWLLKVAIGFANVRIGHHKSTSDARKAADTDLVRSAA